MPEIEEIAETITEHFTTFEKSKCIVVSPYRVWRLIRVCLGVVPGTRDANRIMRSPDSFILHVPENCEERLRGMMFTDSLMIMGLNFSYSEKGYLFKKIFEYQFYSAERRWIENIVYGEWT
jgi:hypothetical protein